MRTFGGVQMARVSLGGHADDDRLCPAARWGEGSLQEQGIVDTDWRLACVCVYVRLYD